MCHQSIQISNNVKIGGGTTIFDTNFHSIKFCNRASKDDLKDAITSPILIII